jgi:hypothetical protein
VAVEVALCAWPMVLEIAVDPLVSLTWRAG